MYQFLAENEAAAGTSDSPTRDIVGATARGPINFIINPTRPLIPRKTSNKEARIMAPWIYKASNSIINFFQMNTQRFCRKLALNINS
jgi:hypothetical protein